MYVIYAVIYVSGLSWHRQQEVGGKNVFASIFWPRTVPG